MAPRAPRGRRVEEDGRRPERRDRTAHQPCLVRVRPWPLGSRLPGSPSPPLRLEASASSACGALGPSTLGSGHGPLGRVEGSLCCTLGFGHGPLGRVRVAHPWLRLRSWSLGPGVFPFAEPLAQVMVPWAGFGLLTLGCVCGHGPLGRVSSLSSEPLAPVMVPRAGFGSFTLGCVGGHGPLGRVTSLSK